MTRLVFAASGKSLAVAWSAPRLTSPQTCPEAQCSRPDTRREPESNPKFHCLPQSRRTVMRARVPSSRRLQADSAAVLRLILFSGSDFHLWRRITLPEQAHNQIVLGYVLDRPMTDVRIGAAQGIDSEYILAALFVAK